MMSGVCLLRRYTDTVVSDDSDDGDDDGDNDDDGVCLLQKMY